MIGSNKLHRLSLLLLSAVLLFSTAAAQKKSKATKETNKAKETSTGHTPVVWKPINIRQQDLFLGPGGKDMQPDLSSITFVSQKPGGHSLKYNIKDGAG